MATESPVRLLGNSGGRNWPASQETTAFTTSSNSMAAKELGLLMKDHRFKGNQIEAVPNRSGSAPPSMEGSFAAIRNFIGQQNASLDHNLANTSNAVESCESEEQLRADPAYLAYYLSNVNLNPRLPPPLISRENRHLAHHFGRLGDNRQMVSFDDNSNASLFPYRASLATHKEEPEDDRSPMKANAAVDTGIGFLSEQSASSVEVRHKSLVDLIQEDFPRTPSPVFSQSRSSNHGSTEAVDSDSRQYLSAAPLLSSSSSDRTASPHLGPKGESTNADIQLDSDGLITAVVGSITTNNESEMKSTSISNEHRSQYARQHPQQNSSHTRGSASQVQVALPQLISQGIRRSHNGMDNFSHGPAKVPPVEVPVLQTTGISPPLYATATAYMSSGNPFFHNLQPSNLFAPQYNVSGYGLNTPVMPPFLPGYPPHGAIPMPLDNPTSSSINCRPTGVTTGVGITPGVDLQQLYKFYGQLGVAVQPSFTDPLYINYFQHPSMDPYGGIGQYDTMASRGSAVGSQIDNYDPQIGPSPAAYSPDRRTSYVRSGGVSIPSHGKGGIASPNYYGSPPSMGLIMQYPTSPLGSPVIPGSPVAGPNIPGRRNENVRLPVSSSRNAGAYSGWQGQRGREKLDVPKPYSFLEELKSSKARKVELSDIAGHVVEFSADQHGSRFIQQKLENCSNEEKSAVFEEVLPHVSTLMTDVFGNYVIQKFFEHGNAEQKKELANQLSDHILPLSLQMYGCRVIQKALEVIELDQKTQLVQELDGHVMRCVRDQNGNHVVQKCIECVPTEKIGFIISAFRGQVATLSTHPYGCRVIQRVLEHCTDKSQSQCIVDEILQSACILAQDQYGNYVTQHVLEKGKPHERSQIISKLAGQIVQMSQHKFASNVIEKCLEHGDTAERELLIEEIVGQTEGNDNLLIMMKDQFANYVVQKILETCTNKQREILLNRIRIHLPALKKYTYGKHIVARVEQFSGEETLVSES